MKSPNMLEKNIEKIGELFPNVITEAKDTYTGKINKAINFELLKQMLSDEIVEGSEAYEFTWVGKKESMAEAYKTISKTLRPEIDKSINWDTTKNLYIEGDNLEVLKLIQENYLNKIKMIYIDPPYNTGHDLIYSDHFSQNISEYELESGVRSDEGNKLIKNTEVNGRFHSDWCSMIYPRLLLSRNLLTDDGVIFISIDDNEQENLKSICNEVFGEKNFIAQLVWERAYSPKNDAKYISNSHDYILMYAKDINSFQIGRLPRTDEANARYQNPDNDPRGVWMSDNMTVKTYNAASDYPIKLPSGRTVEPPAGRCWSLSKNKFLERLQDNRIWFGPDGNGTPRIKRFLSELKFDGMAPTSLLFYKDVGHSQEGAKETTELLGGGYFDGPKPVRLLKRLITLANLNPDSIVLDFFSGSGSTAQAVMETNIENNRNCSFILVQIPEETNPKSKAYDAGFENICEIGSERIRKVFEKLTPLHENHGFRYFKTDTSNMKDIYYSPDSLNQLSLNFFESNIKDNRTDLDLLFGCVLDWGLPLSSPYSLMKIGENTIHNYDDGELVACFDQNISEKVIKEIAKLSPNRVVFRDSSFATDAARVNVDEIFKLFSPDTEVKVL